MSLAEHIDLQREMDAVARYLLAQGEPEKARVVLKGRSRMHDLREKLDRIHTMSG